MQETPNMSSTSHGDHPFILQEAPRIREIAEAVKERGSSGVLSIIISNAIFEAAKQGHMQVRLNLNCSKQGLEVIAEVFRKLGYTVSTDQEFLDENSNIMIKWGCI